MPKVYVVCEPIRKIEGVFESRMNLNPALKFGEIEVLLPNMQSLIAPVPTVRLLNEKLKNFTDEDYILPVGDPALIATVAMVASKLNGGKIKILKWDKIIKEYLTIQVDISGRAQ